MLASNEWKTSHYIITVLICPSPSVLPGQCPGVSLKVFKADILTSLPKLKNFPPGLPSAADGALYLNIRSSHCLPNDLAETDL